MAIQSTDLIFYCSANMPTDDFSVSGGAIDTTMRINFTKWSAANQVALISDGTDTRSVDLAGRLANGTLSTETVVLTSAAEKLSVASYVELLMVKAQTTSASRVVTIKQGSVGATRGTIPLNEKGFRALFYDSISQAGAVPRYEKIFGKNAHATLSHLACQFALVADPLLKLKIATATTVNDTASVVNRFVAPASLTFVDDNVILNVGDLAAGNAWGVWIEQTLDASNVANHSTYTVQMLGGTAA